MAQPLWNMYRARRKATLGVIAVVAVAMLPRPQSSDAAGLSSLQGRVAGDRHRVEATASELSATRADLQRTMHDRDAMVTEVSRRVVTMYKSGRASRVAAITLAGVEDMISRAGVMSTVVEHDVRLLGQYRVLGERVRRLRRQESELAARLRDARADLERDEQRLARAEREEAARRAHARAVAARLATVADSPLSTSSVSAESVAVAISNGGSGSGAPAGFRQGGIASMYADSFAGQSTASGERYSPTALTAAHPSLPLGTWVLVSGPGGSVVVRINDRGPFVGGRIIDLSRAAADAVGLGGLGSVTITVQR